MLNNPFFYLCVAGVLAGILLGLGGFRVSRARRPLRYRARRRFLVPVILGLIVVVAGAFFFTDVMLVLEYRLWAAGMVIFPMILLRTALVLPRSLWGWVARVVLTAVLLLPLATGWLWRSVHDPQHGAVTVLLEVPEALAEVVVGVQPRAGDALQLVVGNDQAPASLISRDGTIEVIAQVLERIPPLWWWYPARQVSSLRLEHSDAVIYLREVESFPGAFQDVLDRYPVVSENVVTTSIPQRPEEWLQPGTYQFTWNPQSNRLLSRYTGR